MFREATGSPELGRSGPASQRLRPQVSSQAHPEVVSRQAGPRYATLCEVDRTVGDERIGPQSSRRFQAHTPKSSHGRPGSGQIPVTTPKWQHRGLRRVGIPQM